ncbi:MAG: hypothetical protein ACE5GA_00950 [Candidatus Zixiibacteriota bacterium]
MLAIGFIGDALEFVSSNIGSILGGVGSAALAVIGWVGSRHLVPLLQVGKRKQFAQWIAVIADEVTDALVARYPNKRWLEALDEAVDSLVEICGVSQEISRRAVDAALARKNNNRT